MSTAIGIRVSPKFVQYAIAGREADAILIRDVNIVTIPSALQQPEQLRFVRTTLLDILDEYGVDSAGIRLTEPMAKSKNVFRLNLEGVVQELLASSDVEAYFWGPIATIAAWLGEHRSQVKQFIDGDASFDRVATWAEYRKSEEREAVLVALAALALPTPARR